LATVYGAISQSGGCVVVSSKLGEGTTIQIYLPQVEDAIEVAAEPAVVPSGVRPTETILVVDDDDAVRRMTITFLKIAGYNVVEARSAAEALDSIGHSGGSISLVLTDVSMPKMTGRELVEQLLKVESGLKVLYMSAYTEDAAINCGLHNPGTAFIEKPFSPDELARKVREVLASQPHVNHGKYVQHHA
jgi:two-component system, cell cycle sensor histidine kinase and response regulator CckA